MSTRQKAFKIVAYVLGTPVLIVLLFTIIIVIRFALSKDIPPPDDSDLRVIAAPIPDEQNAYRDIVTIAEEYKELEAQDPSLRESIYDAVEEHRPPPEICLNLPTEHPALYQAFLSASSKEVIQPPTFSGELTLSDLMIKKPYFDLLKAAKFIDCHARALMVANRTDEAININERIMRLGQLVLNAGDGTMGALVGAGTLKLGMSTLQVFARTGELSSAQLLSSLRTLESYGVNRESILNLLSSEYNYYLVAISSIADDVGSNHLWFQPNHTQKMLVGIMRKHFKELENPCLPSPADKDLSKEERSIYESLWHDGEPLPKASLRNFFKTGHDIVVGVDRSIWAPLFGKAFSNFREKASSILTLVSIIIDPNGTGTLIAKTLNSGFPRISRNFCDIATDFTGTQLVLALWAYHQDRGYFPDRLGALVPAYLQNIPASPTAQQQIVYSKEMELITFGEFISPSNSYSFSEAPIVTPIYITEDKPELRPEPTPPPKGEAPAPQALSDNTDLLKQKPDQIVRVTISQEILPKFRKDIDNLYADIRNVRPLDRTPTYFSYTAALGI